MKSNIIIALLLFLALVSFSFKIKDLPVAKSQINWMTWAAVQEAQKKKPKKVFVDVYTYWCVWCKEMDETIFKNQKVVAYINENFYAVKFNAEQRETIVFKNQKYHYTKTGKRAYNELAKSLLNGVMSFPATVCLDENLNVLTTLNGILEPSELDPILSFFATNSHLKMKWSKYLEKYKSIL